MAEELYDRKNIGKSLVDVGLTCLSIVDNVTSIINSAKYSLLAILSIILIMIVVAMFNPLRRSREKIREQMLESIPIGTSMEDAIEIVSSNPKWRVTYKIQSYGYIIKDGKLRDPTPNQIVSGDAIGEQYIRVRLGEYRTIFTVDVAVYFAFDGDGKLIDAHVQKQIDGIF